MYETHFGLRQRPFRPTPDRDAYYPATSHEVALGRVLQARDEDEGLVLLTGEPGTGKTLLCHRLIERAGEGSVCVFVTNCHFAERAALFQAILFDLSLPYETRSEQELRLTLTEHLLDNFAAGRRNLIILDEAQHLSVDLLEELRLFGNLEARQSKAVQIVLSAQPALEGQLEQPELACLRQRLMVRVPLEPLGVHESADYLVHQLRQAGGKPERIVTDEALDILARGARGIPRLLNQAARQALGLAFEARVKPVDAEVALEALTLLGLEVDLGDPAQELAVVAREEPATEIGLSDEDLDAVDPACAHGLMPSPRRPA